MLRSIVCMVLIALARCTMHLIIGRTKPTALNVCLSCSPSACCISVVCRLTVAQPCKIEFLCVLLLVCVWSFSKLFDGCGCFFAWYQVACLDYNIFTMSDGHPSLIISEVALIFLVLATENSAWPSCTVDLIAHWTHSSFFSH